MKKTVLGIITIVMLAVMMLSTTVNAASLSTDKEKMEKGDIVTITIKTNEEVESMQFDLKFDSTKYKLVENSVKTDLKMLDYNIVNDTLVVSAFDTSTLASTLTVQFEAIENGEAIPFSISNTEFSKDGEEINDTVTNATVTVTVADKEVDVKPVDPTPSDPTVDETPGTDNEQQPNEDNNKDNNEGYVDEDGNPITKIPQTGTYIPTVILGVAILGVAIMLGYRMIKNN